MTEPAAIDALLRAMPGETWSGLRPSVLHRELAASLALGQSALDPLLGGLA